MNQGDQQIIRLLKNIWAALGGTSVSGGGGGASGGTFQSTPVNLGSSANTVIPAGVLSWSVTNTAGFVLFNNNAGSGSVNIPTGVTFKGGGYTGFRSKTPITITTAAGGTAVILYDTVG